MTGTNNSPETFQVKKEKEKKSTCWSNWPRDVQVEVIGRIYGHFQILGLLYMKNINPLMKSSKYCTIYNLHYNHFYSNVRLNVSNYQKQLTSNQHN